MDNKNLELKELLKIKEIKSSSNINEINNRLKDGYKIIAIEKIFEASGDEVVNYHYALL